MKKLTILTLVLLMCCMGFFVSCDKDPCQDGHTEIVDSAVAPTCTEKGKTEGKHCAVCNEVLVAQNDVEALGHNYVSVATPPTVKDQGYTTHTCLACGDSYKDSFVPATDSLGLSYEINANRTTCTVTGTGTCTDTEVYISEKIGVYTVTAIGERAFAQNSTLTFMKIPNTVKEIGIRAFYKCTALSEITIPDSVTSIGSFAFCYCSSLTSITIPDGVTSIGNCAFCYCSSLTNITISDSVTSIGPSAFGCCSSLTSITISDSVTSIGSSAFYDCSSLKTVYYTGTAEDWAIIFIDSYNTALENATRYYYSETKPTTSGNYWRYVDGVPTIW